MKLTVLIPAKNEEDVIESTVNHVYQQLQAHGIDHEILVINDHSTDTTTEKLDALKKEMAILEYLDNTLNTGFGNAIRFGLNHYKGDAVAIVMADSAEDPADIAKCFMLMEESGADCVFGSRFVKHGKVVNYPFISLILNRLFNNFIRVFFYRGYNDFTNSFKLYHEDVLEAIKPLSAENFSITIELSLKALKHAKRVEAPPISWKSREKGVSKFNLFKNLPDYLRVLIKMRSG